MNNNICKSSFRTKNIQMTTTMTKRAMISRKSKNMQADQATSISNRRRKATRNVQPIVKKRHRKISKKIPRKQRRKKIIKRLVNLILRGTAALLIGPLKMPTRIRSISYSSWLPQLNTSSIQCSLVETLDAFRITARTWSRCIRWLCQLSNWTNLKSVSITKTWRSWQYSLETRIWIAHTSSLEEYKWRQT